MSAARPVHLAGAGGGAGGGGTAVSKEEQKPLLESAGGPRSPTTSPRGQKVGFVPLLGCNLVLDDENADYVLVFQKFIVAQDEMVENPLEKARMLFVRRANADSVQTMDEPEIKAMEGKTSMSQFDYQTAIRNVIWRTLHKMGLNLSVFESVDGDETFLKIHLPLSGKLIRKLAQRYRYKMKLKESVYHTEHSIIEQIMGKKDIPKEELVPMNKNGKPVAAFINYSYDFAHLVEDFNQTDAVRLLRSYLEEWLDLGDLCGQSVCRCAFPATKFESVTKLFEIFGNWKLMFTKLPSLHNLDPIRFYLGEKVALYFYWFAFYTLSLIPLAVVGFITFLRRMERFDIPLDMQHYMQIAFSVFCCGWSCYFNISFLRTSSRSILRWGMIGFEGQEMDRSNYDVTLEGNKSHEIKNRLASLVPGIYCFIYAVGILTVEVLSAFLKTKGIDWLDKGKGIILAIAVNGGNFIWGKLAPVLVEIQNHRTQLRWEDALSKSLVMVKLFVATFPFFNICFLQTFTQYKCPLEEENQTFASIVWEAYMNGTDFPTGLGMVPMKDQYTFNEDGERFLEGFTLQINGQECLQGCIPKFCKGVENCDTNCMMDLQHSLLTVFVTFAVTSMVACLIPMLQLQYAMQVELEAVNGGQDGGSCKVFKIIWKILTRLRKAAAKQAADSIKEANAAAIGAAGGSAVQVAVDSENYTLLQFQSKQYDVAQYGYALGGGSRVEDFMDLAIGFTLITTFSITLPVMTVVAFLCCVVIYRLTAFRMTCVTCRPQPDGAESIGIWQAVFEAITAQAGVVNVAIAVLTLSPLREMSALKKLAFFLVGEHLLIALRLGIYAAVPATPHDATNIANTNTRFVDLLENKMSSAYRLTNEDLADIEGRSEDPGKSKIQCLWKQPEESMFNSLLSASRTSFFGSEDPEANVEGADKKAEAADRKK